MHRDRWLCGSDEFCKQTGVRSVDAWNLISIRLWIIDTMYSMSTASIFMRQAQRSCRVQCWTRRLHARTDERASGPLFITTTVTDYSEISHKSRLYVEYNTCYLTLARGYVWSLSTDATRRQTCRRTFQRDYRDICRRFITCTQYQLLVWYDVFVSVPVINTTSYEKPHVIANVLTRQIV